MPKINFTDSSDHYTVMISDLNKAPIILREISLEFKKHARNLEDVNVEAKKICLNIQGQADSLKEIYTEVRKEMFLKNMNIYRMCKSILHLTIPRILKSFKNNDEEMFLLSI